ncbi:ras association domain-containing protein 4 isoform X2 [Myotis daubentonii]|uniref:ras association domain-containing protein 4 isoform X2 n=1 Tax=Myotis daubentonii TaxID=98922 RepID=UPI0028732742|nr:ras association domain-containing protein 4 isoform X2 [Myotis daubentonii]
MKEDCAPSSHVPISDSKSILKSELLNLLKTYNCYHEGKSFQLRHREEEGALVVEGLLNIAWGLRRPIRLQMQDDREPAPLISRLDAGQPSCRLKEPLLQGGTAQQPGPQPSEHRPERASDSSGTASQHVTGAPPGPDPASLPAAGPPEEDEETPQLMRTRSDAACVIQRRPRCRTPGDTQRTRRHRFSINGHFYNHKTSVFTPAYGSVTNVRVNSTMTTLQVLSLLLSKFRVENGPSEFALYVVHESGERTKLKDCEYPLISRVLHGPSEKIARIFLMEADLGEEVPHDVPSPASDDAAAPGAAGGGQVASQSPPLPKPPAANAHPVPVSGP